MYTPSNRKHKWAFQKEPKPEKETYMELQDLVNLSWFLIKLHSAILYGLMEGELPDVDRCNFYVEKGKRLGLEPDDNYLPELI